MFRYINEIVRYYGVSEKCAIYMYYRVSRSKRKNDTFLPWNVQIQNALVTADKCLGIEWDKLVFGEEYKYLLRYNIDLSDISDTPITWNTEPKSEWTIVTKKKKPSLLKEIGLIE